MKIKTIIGIIISAILSFLIIFLDSVTVQGDSMMPKEVYRVYLGGNSIGLINSKSELEDFINIQQEKIKTKYNVDKIYIPNDIDVVKELTYDSKINSVVEIYNTINNISPFTIRGFEVTIDRTNSIVYKNDDNTGDENRDSIVKLYVISKEIFKEAVENVVLSFVDETDYKAFIENDQLEIETTGELIEDIYIDDVITIKETNISVDNNIYMNTADLSKYLIFSDYEETLYSVKATDTIDSIAENNKMSVNELLIANPKIKNRNVLLYTGQKLSIGTLDPIFTTVVEKHVVEDQKVTFKTDYQYDSKKMKGYSKVLQQGSNGVTRVTQKLQLINGEITNALISSSEEITPVINKLVLKGGKPARTGDGAWVWPTKIPYIISSGYGWRWGKLHRGVDICGTGSGSPIYASRAGTVVDISYGSVVGYYITLSHANGYYTRYLHLLNSKGKNGAGGVASSFKYVSIGSYVEAGEVIGDMGTSGGSTGTHLHFEIWDGPPYHTNSNSYNPLNFF